MFSLEGKNKTELRQNTHETDVDTVFRYQRGCFDWHLCWGEFILFSKHGLEVGKFKFNTYSCVLLPYILSIYYGFGLNLLFTI